MRLKIKIVLIFFIFTQVTLSQNKKANNDQTTITNPHIITIDFKDKTISELPKEIEVGEYYQINIKNINMNIWNINYSSSDSTITKALKTPTFEEITLTNLNSLVSSFNSFTTVKALNLEELSGTEKALLKKNGAEITNNCEEFASRLAYSPKEFLGLFIPSIEQAKKKYDELRFNIYIYELKLLEESQEMQTSYHYESTLRSIEDIKESLEGAEEVAYGLRKIYDSLVNVPVNRKCLDKNKELQTLHSKNLDVYNSFQSKIIEIRDQLKADKVIPLIKNVHFLKNGQNEYTSLPMQFTGELAKVSLKFSPQKPEYNEQTYEMDFEFPKIPTKSYWSLGASFFTSTLSDSRYSILGNKVNDSITNYSVIKEKSDNVELGIATTLRFGKKFKTNDNIGYHGSFGAGVNIGENIRPRLLLGFGFSIGKKHSLSLDTGIIAGYTDVLSNSIDMDTDYDLKPENLTITKLRLGGYFSIGYLFRI